MSKLITVPFQTVNAFIIIGEKVVIVDTGSPKDGTALMNIVKNTGIDFQDISLIIHTHAHYDHCGSTAELKKKTNAVVAIHQADAPFLVTGESAPIAPVNLFGKMLMPFLVRISQYEPVTPDLLFDGKFDLRPYGVEGKAIPTPGHTNGSASILLDSGDAIVGDLIGGGKLLGLIQPERPRFHHWYADFPAAKKNISKIIAFNPKQIFVGHGGPLAGPKAIEYFSTRM